MIIQYLTKTEQPFTYNTKGKVSISQEMFSQLSSIKPASSALLLARPLSWEGKISLVDGEAI